MPRGTVTIRWLVGLLLIAAAGMKLYGLGVSAMPARGWFANSWVQLAAAEWEIVLGMWLLSGALAWESQLAATLTFICFAGASGYLALSEVESCGCLGVIEVSPWWTFAVDVALVTILTAMCFGKRTPQAGGNGVLKWLGLAIVILPYSADAILPALATRAGGEVVEIP